MCGPGSFQDYNSMNSFIRVSTTLPFPLWHQYCRVRHRPVRECVPQPCGQERGAWDHIDWPSSWPVSRPYFFKRTTLWSWHTHDKLWGERKPHEYFSLVLVASLDLRQGLSLSTEHNLCRIQACSTTQAVCAYMFNLLQPKRLALTRQSHLVWPCLYLGPRSLNATSHLNSHLGSQLTISSRLDSTSGPGMSSASWAHLIMVIEDESMCHSYHQDILNIHPFRLNQGIGLSVSILVHLRNSFWIMTA